MKKKSFIFIILLLIATLPCFVYAKGVTSNSDKLVVMIIYLIMVTGLIMAAVFYTKSQNKFKKSHNENASIKVDNEAAKEISAEEKKELIKKLPKFYYHPNVYENDIVEFKKGICDCCGKEAKAYLGMMYTKEHVDCICMECVASGEAAKKFNGSFIEDAEDVSDPKKREELFSKTPGYVSWQGEHWLACCDDYCEFIGDAGIKELEKLDSCEEVLKECSKNYDWEYDDLKRDLTAGGTMAGYLFKCKHCGKYHLYVDLS